MRHTVESGRERGPAHLAELSVAGTERPHGVLDAAQEASAQSDVPSVHDALRDFVVRVRSQG